MEYVRDIVQVMTRRIGLLNKNCCSIDGIDISVAQSHILYEINRHNQQKYWVWISQRLAAKFKRWSKLSLYEKHLIQMTVEFKSCFLRRKGRT